VSKDEVFINGDYSRLKQVLINILKNSVEAISKYGKIDISLKLLKKYVLLSIKDNGCGMSNEELGKIDELFYSSKKKGCGIGVSLSKEIISLHNGSIKYKSDLGKGTEVVIKLPIVNN
jgi:two-component system sporulation sensor kinase B